MLLEDVLAVTAALSGAGVGHWLAGGWGVDALVGRQTRPHRDLDLALDAAALDAALHGLAGLGYRPETDWLPSGSSWPLPAPRWVDLHPVVFGPDGHGRQAGLDGTHFDYPAADLVTGVLAGQPLPCLSAPVSWSSTPATRAARRRGGPRSPDAPCALTRARRRPTGVRRT